MKHSVTIECLYYHREDLVKNGHSEHGTQRYRCKPCRRRFQWGYRYTAWAPGTKEQIVEHTLNGSGVRDISRDLGIAKHTVIAELKKKALRTYLKRLHRKTMCFSKSEMIHDNVIGMYIHRHDYQGCYGKVA